MAAFTDAELTAECIEAWSLDQPGEKPRFEGDEQEPSHMLDEQKWPGIVPGHFSSVWRVGLSADVETAALAAERVP
jgi:hypothetical protein